MPEDDEEIPFGEEMRLGDFEDAGEPRTQLAFLDVWDEGLMRVRPQ